MIPAIKTLLAALFALASGAALAPADSLYAELEAFADAAGKRAPFPVAPAQMLQTVAAFEAVVRALEATAARSRPA